MKTRRSILLGMAGALALAAAQPAEASGLVLKGGRPGGGGGGGGSLAPAAGWNGTPGTGFAASGASSLATLTTADPDDAPKPVLHPLILQHHMVTGTDGTQYLVFAARGGKKTLQKVRIWFEGNFADLTTRQTISYTDLRGTARKFRNVFAIALDYSACQIQALNGHGYCLAEAWSTDGTWRRQVTEAIRIHVRPGASLAAGSRYDELKTVGPSGKDFTTLGAAMGYAAGATKTNTIVGIRIDADGNYNPSSTVERLTGAVPMEVFANSGVTAARMGDFSANLTAQSVGSLRFRGPGILIDTSTSKNLTWIFNLGGSGHVTDGILQFEGIEAFSGNGGASASANGVAGSGASITVNGDQPPQFYIGNISTNPTPRIAWKDCSIHDMGSYGPAFSIQTINCDLSRISGSPIENHFGVVHGGTIDDCGGVCSGFMDRSTPHLVITFAGAGTPTVYKSTGNSSTGNLELRINGVADLTIAITSSMTQAQLAVAINTAGNANWSCTTPASNALAARYIAFPAYAPSHGIGTDGDSPAPFTGGTCSLIFATDIHADTFVWTVTARNNILFEFVKVTNMKSVAGISLYDTARRNMVFGNLFMQDITQTLAFTSLAGFLTTIGNDHIWLENITHLGGTQTSIPGGGEYVSNASFGTNCGTKDCYLVSFDGPGDTALASDGLITRGPLPTSGTTNSLSTGMAAESGYMNTTTGVPTLAGSLLNPAGRYSGAFVPSALADSTNDGWLLAA